MSVSVTLECMCGNYQNNASCFESDSFFVNEKDEKCYAFNSKATPLITLSIHHE